MGRRRWFTQGNRRSSPDLQAEIARRGIRLFSYESIRLATQDFQTLIGTGGYSNVYHGVMDDETQVAIKVFKSDMRDFKNGFLDVIEVMSHIQHKNINRVIGCCVQNDVRILVSEYIDNKTLYDLIRDSERRSSILNWQTRIALCIGIARGISYLHNDIHPRVIHRDIKSTNILLDSNYTPKITDFETVDFIYHDDDLPLDDLVQGTIGYLDPEYFHTGQYTEKVDVYGFGVVMLEVLSGRRVCLVGTDNEQDRLICNWASRSVAENTQLEMVDPSLGGDFPEDEALRFIELALLCTQTRSDLRPSMYEILLTLSGVCNSCNQALRMITIQVTDVEDEGDITPSFTEILSADVDADSNSEGQAEGDRDDSTVEVSASSQILVEEQIKTAIVSEVAVELQQMRMKPGIILSGSGDLVERLSQTMVIKRQPKIDFPEAVYPPFQTSVFPRRLGSRKLYAFKHYNRVT